MSLSLFKDCVYLLAWILCGVIFADRVQAAAEIFSLPDQAEYAEIKGVVAEKKWTLALELLEKTSGGPKSEPSKSMLYSELLFRLGKRANAVQVLQGLARDLESSQKFAAAQAVKKKAITFARQFRTQESLQDYQDGLQLLEEGSWKPALEKFEKGLKLEFGEHLDLLVRKGQVLYLIGSSKLALETMEHALRIGIADPNLSIWMGKTQSLLGKSTEAQKNILEGLALNPMSQVGGMALVDLLVSMQKKDDAIKWIQTHLEKQPYHLQLLARGAELRLGRLRIDSKENWSIRKDLQLGMSRLAEYKKKNASLWEGDLGLDLREADKIQQKMAGLLEKLDPKLR